MTHWIHLLQVESMFGYVKIEIAPALETTVNRGDVIKHRNPDGTRKNQHQKTYSISKMIR